MHTSFYVVDTKNKIDQLHREFCKLKTNVKKCLEKRKVTVESVADALTSLLPDENEEHRVFLEEHNAVLFRAANISEQFGTMNLHWNYLDPSLLDNLVKQFDLEAVKQMEEYKSELIQFRLNTPLKAFCETQKKRKIKLTDEFQEMVAEFEWPDDVKLEHVEEFRQEYCCHYKLNDCAMMIAKCELGSFIITWLIPESTVQKLKQNLPQEIFIKYHVKKLTIAGCCVYTQYQEVRKVQLQDV